MMFPFVPFLEAVSDCTGGNVKVQRSAYALEGKLPVIDQGQEFIAGFTDNANQYRGELPLVLFGDHTRSFKYVDFPFALGADGVKALEPQSGFDAKFLYYYFKFVDLPSAGYSRHFKFLKEIQVPKPTLAEQRRIVDLLSRADGIVRLRREAQQKAAELVPAIFLEMFGDPGTNPKGWPASTLGKVVQEFRYGTSQKSGPTGLPVLRIPNVIGNHLELSEMKLVDVSKAEVDRLRLVGGDFLFVRTNGNQDYVGRSAVFNSEVMADAGFDGSNTLYASYLIRARIQQNILNPYFLQGMLTSREGRRAIKERCKTSAGQFNINTDGLGSIPIFLPPIAFQADFVRRCHDVFSIQTQQATAAAKAQAIFDALLARVFA